MKNVTFVEIKGVSLMFCSQGHDWHNQTAQGKEDKNKYQ